MSGIYIPASKQGLADIARRLAGLKGITLLDQRGDQLDHHLGLLHLQQQARQAHRLPTGQRGITVQRLPGWAMAWQPPEPGYTIEPELHNRDLFAEP